MAHKNREGKNNFVELTLRVRVRWCREKIWSIRKWILPLLATVLVKVAIHFLRHG